MSGWRIRVSEVVAGTKVCIWADSHLAIGNVMLTTAPLLVAYAT